MLEVKHLTVRSKEGRPLVGDVSSRSISNRCGYSFSLKIKLL